MSERVNHPSHYNGDWLVEVIDVARHMPFSLGNALKYLCRAGSKSDANGNSLEVEDLEKAKWYLKDVYKHSHDGYLHFSPTRDKVKRLAEACKNDLAASIVKEMYGSISLRSVAHWVTALEAVS